MTIDKRLYNAKCGGWIQNYFSRRARQTLEHLESFLPVLEFPIDVCWSLSEASIKSCERYEIDSRLWNAKFRERIQNYFWEREANLGTLQKLFTYIGVSYQFVLKSLKTLIWIFLAMEYCFKALECQLSLMNAKSFFWENVANRKTLQNLSSYVGISYKFFLKSVKSLNPLFWVIKYWFKAFEYQIWSTNTKSLFWGSEANIGAL